MAASLKYWKEAATLLLVAKTRVPSVTSFQTTNYEVLMLKRSGKSKFMPKLHVFPGGLADDADFSPEWLDIFGGADSEVLTGVQKFVSRGGPGAFMFSRERAEKFSKIPSDLAFRICAIRETFEESGILLVRDLNSVKNKNIDEGMHPVSGKSSVFSDTILEPWRDRVDGNASEFIEMCRELKVVPDVWSLYEWSNWLTPIAMAMPQKELKARPGGRRYDTAFYICVLDYIPHAVHCNKETTELEWSSASQFIEKHKDRSNELRLAPPQVTELGRLLNFTDAAELRKFAYERSAVRCIRYLPVPCFAEDCVLVIYPGDDLYPEHPDFEGTRPPMTVEGKREELRAGTRNLNRLEIYTGDHGDRVDNVLSNVALADGMVNPPVEISFTTALPKL